MRRVLCLFLMICLAALPALAQDDDIRALLDRYAAAWGTLDPASAAPLYAKDADLVFYDILPLKFTGWTEYEQGVKPHFAEFASLKLTPKGDLKVTRHGNVAWTTATFGLEVKPKQGEAMAMDVRQTLILERRGGSWLIVHEHFSTPLSMHEHD